jgi:hypothetical protein
MKTNGEFLHTLVLSKYKVFVRSQSWNMTVWEKWMVGGWDQRDVSIEGKGMGKDG